MSPEKYRFYQSAARRHAASTLLYKVDSVVHVEDRDDIDFWKMIFDKYRPVSYKFLPGSNNADGKRASGCEQCLNYKDFLCQRFFICIDSDLRYLLDENLKAEDGVLQTYTYSWENHCCFAEKLQNEFSAQTERGHIFDFVEFLQKYSEIVYIPFLIMLYHERNRIPGFDRERFKQIISLQYQRGDEKDNGKQLLERLSAGLHAACEPVIEELDIDVHAEIRKYEAKGVTRDTVYLYVRGHCLYNLLTSLGKKLCSGTGVDFEHNILKPTLAFERYDAIQKIRRDIAILNGIRYTC
ncbi:MAG: DUF4435 domain-containing protein [Muribaculaceae bacterium]|nr:DUF4435 domain-containing protein [Muribaculaceae bacterium]